jgi:histidine kinase
LGARAQAIEEEARPQFSFKNQTFENRVPPDLPSVNADGQRIKQVIHHLLSNASTFTPEGGTITMEAKDVGGKVEVSDTGIGLEGKDLEKVFERFPDLKRARGLGLGLSICRGLIELHGGEIWAESEGKGKGATFRFTLQKYSEKEK